MAWWCGRFAIKSRTYWSPATTTQSESIGVTSEEDVWAKSKMPKRKRNLCSVKSFRWVKYDYCMLLIQSSIFFNCLPVECPVTVFSSILLLSLEMEFLMENFFFSSFSPIFFRSRYSLQSENRNHFPFSEYIFIRFSDIWRRDGRFLLARSIKLWQITACSPLITHKTTMTSPLIDLSRTKKIENVRKCF